MRSAGPRLAAGAGAFLVVATAALLFVHRYAVDWVAADDTLMVDWLGRLGTGALRLRDLPSLWDNQHPLGAEVAATWLVVALVGLHLKAVVYVSLAVILLTAFGAWRLARDAASGAAADAGLALALALLALHPIQMEHLLWAFELGWFMVNGCVVANALAVERLGLRALPLVALLCLVATFSSAQGAFAWFAAASHVGLRRRCRTSWGAVAALAACGAAAILHVALHPAGPGQEAPPTPETLLHLPAFALELLGTGLGTRNHLVLLVAGTALLGLAAGLGTRLARGGADSGRLRCGMVLIGFAMLCLLGFARGRLAFGLDWALGTFHAAPLLVPFWFGAVLLLAEAARVPRRRDRTTALLALPLALLLAAGWGLSWSYGAQRARLWAMERGYARWAACRKAVPFETAVRAAGAEPYRSTFAAAQDRLSAMCTDRPATLAATLTREPPLFARLSADHPEARATLDAIWQDYATEDLLQRAFDPGKPDTPARLLALARAEALRGPPFDHLRWTPFRSVLLGLP